MIKTVLIGVVIFAVALGGSAGFVIWRAPAPAVAADSTHAADSVAAADSVQDHSAAASDSSAPSVEPAGGDTTSHQPVAAVDSPVTTPPMVRDSARPERPAPAVPPAVSAALAQADSQKALQQLARIFTNMKPADAAKILGYLSDAQVEGIIRQLGVRQAAQLMGELPTERAATLSRRFLATGSPSTQGSR